MMAPSFALLLPFLSNLLLGAAGYCGWCENAPSRTWTWLFGYGECKCYKGWSGSCCNEWEVSDWSQKVAEWSKGDSCKSQPQNACKLNSNLPATKEYNQTWKYQPTSYSQSQCEATEGCLWVECFEDSGNGLPYSTSDPEEMCSHCGGPWQGHCEWKHYTPGFLAFAGPGEHCGFSYPVCPASEAKNCFCGEAAKEIKNGWCHNNGAGMDAFCPSAMKHADGRTQQCSWNGWTVSPQASGGIDASCKAWGLA
mmetsp:Transcript_26820/g.46545  ORF Transcript_26820/g.46545 Transcript_26820/m.46545 type:complete len:252 (-) Transcript_26820:47-802(-)